MKTKAVCQGVGLDQTNIKASGCKSKHLDGGRSLGITLGEIRRGWEMERWCGINGILHPFS